MIFYLANTGVDLGAVLILAAAIAVALITGISFHEFSHAFTADRLGDRLPRARGRVTLNPLAHLDRTGTLLMVLIGFGWGKPVPINPAATHNPKQALWMTALAGPFSNFVVAAAFGLPIKLDMFPYISPFDTLTLDFLDARGMSSDEYFGLFFSSIVLFNVILGIFNLIPIAPLDGFKVVQGLLPHHLAREFGKLEQYGPIILLILIALPFLSGGRFGLLFETMRPFIQTLVQLFTGVDHDPFV
jgi:Zn-dependent protease